MRARLPVVLVGIAVFAVAVAAAFVPGIGASIPVDQFVSQAGSDYKLAAAFGFVALVPVVLVLLIRGIAGQDQATPPDPEEVRTAPIPGANFDDVVENGVGFRERFFGDRHDEIRDRLRETATQTLIRREGIAREQARRRLDDGSWTDDRDAAAFVAGESGPSPPISSRVRAAVRGRTWFQYGAERTADAITQTGGER